MIKHIQIGLKSLLLFTVILIGCKDDPAFPEGCTNATLRDLTGLDGCTWIIELTDGSRLEPVNLNDFDISLSDGLSICIEYQERTDLASICMVGQIIELTSLTEGTRTD